MGPEGEQELDRNDEPRGLRGSGGEKPEGSRLSKQAQGREALLASE
jgi:hypothetical protein